MASTHTRIEFTVLYQNWGRFRVTRRITKWTLPLGIKYGVHNEDIWEVEVRLRVFLTSALLNPTLSIWYY
jgi:hypothetical protein